MMKTGAANCRNSTAFLETGHEHWQTVQSTLIDSQWARRYTIRASTVIAMFDPDYDQAPGVAEQRVEAVLRPPVQFTQEPVHSHPPDRELQQTFRLGRTAKKRSIPVKRKLT